MTPSNTLHSLPLFISFKIVVFSRHTREKSSQEGIQEETKVQRHNQGSNHHNEGAYPSLSDTPSFVHGVRLLATALQGLWAGNRIGIQLLD